ncbi:TIGR01777 family oxidoreductase [Nocardioides solisilvae]|uniref:TIGR01777 family oxidoreductase n=1 Tax=Nocardioides solisilvae TaxID=1542435 RepID=UPI000D74FD6F|nr:TIGR01777 family oxidoreductase [Nocardioides solisilvae]
MRILVAGSSGFLGTHLVEHLRRGGHQVTRLVRHDASTGEIRWDPYGSGLAAGALDGVDVVVNLAGSPTLGNPHSARWAEELRRSRVTTTRVLAEAVAAAPTPPALLAGNGISFYGDHGSAVVTEESASLGDALLTRVTREWQEATEPAVAAGARVCVLRTAPVMDRRAAPLSQLALLFRLGLGARLGNGNQYFPMVSLRDWVGAVAFLAGSRDVSGPFNLCCPRTPTNREMTRALARAVGRPAFLAAPAPVLRLATGPMAPELLGSVNARPAALERAGYDFADADVDDVLATALAAGRQDPAGTAR